MIRKFVAGAAEVLVLLMAAYTFFFVQLGRRTPYEHLRAVLSTQPAQEAAQDFSQAGKQLGQKVSEELQGGASSARPQPSASSPRSRPGGR